MRGGELLPERESASGHGTAGGEEGEEPRETSPEARLEAAENFPIREPRENFCTILPSCARRKYFLKKHFLLLRKIPHYYISKPIEPPEYHRLS
jgi:hypothetical protein